MITLALAEMECVTGSGNIKSGFEVKIGIRSLNSLKAWLRNKEDRKIMLAMADMECVKYQDWV